MPDLQTEPGKIEDFDASHHRLDVARRFPLRGALRAAAISLALLALLALLPTSTGATGRATDDSSRRAVSSGSAAGPCTDTLHDDPDPRVETERARYGLTGTTATNAAAFHELVAAANELLDVRRQRSALLAKLDQPGAGPGSFDATAAELAELDDEYRRQVASAALRYPALGAVLQESGQEDPDLRLLAVAGGPLNSAIDLRQLRPQGEQLGAGAVAHALDAHQRALQQARDAAPTVLHAEPEPRCLVNHDGAAARSASRAVPR
jgi:hypothetical protein